MQDQKERDRLILQTEIDNSNFTHIGDAAKAILASVGITAGIDSERVCKEVADQKSAQEGIEK